MNNNICLKYILENYYIVTADKEKLNYIDKGAQNGNERILDNNVMA